ncbi:hypothetical protein BJX63DRAFT_429025 [Aspergillus granulosus]|uniref:NACHT domain-containing protein n=1 Tax=Aspergillus granulosus TaxID=176169 RepID=A0ABR4HU73_9EURO
MTSRTLDDYRIAWICAMPLEAAAARAMLDKTHSPPQGPTDLNAYEFGELDGHYIVIAHLPAGMYGKVSAATVIARMQASFRQLRFGLMVGIGGGVPGKTNDIRLGDVVVSEPGQGHSGVIQYDYEEAVQGGTFKPTGTSNKPPPFLLTHINQLKRKQMIGAGESVSKVVQEVLEQYPEMKEIFSPPKQSLDLLFDSDYHHPEEKGSCETCDTRHVRKRESRGTETPHIHYGLIASGGQVMKDSETRDRLAQQHGILCFEIEAAGLMGEIPTLVIRGICDYCDSHRQKQWQGYAALTAAAYTKLLLSNVPVEVAAAARSEQDFTSEDQRCLQDLLLSHPSDDLRRIEATNGGLLVDSFQWVLDNAEFRKWHSSPQNQLLRIKGDPGKGKTMLMIGLIDELSRQVQSQPLQSIAYFLCQATDPRLNNATTILQSLIYMLIQQQPYLISHLRESYGTNLQIIDKGATFTNFLAIFENMIQDSTQATTYLLIDALDECETGLSDLLKLIARTKFISATRVKWIISSRNRDDIEQELEFGDKETKLILELNAHHISTGNAVAAYIDDRVSRLKALQHNGTLLEQVKEQLLQKSNGIFLWVALVVQEMQKCPHLAAMVELLEKTPQGLTPLFNQILQQIQLFKSPDRESCVLVLSIVTLGYRPLHLRELSHLAGLHGQQYSPDNLENIVGMCASFLTIRDDHVYLIHQSVKDYLSDSAAIFPSGPFATHNRIFRESLQSLSTKLQRNIYNLDNPGVLVSEIETLLPDADPLFDLRYGCTFWLDHFIDSKSLEKPESSDVQISDFFKQHLLHWLEFLGLIGELRHGILSLQKLSACQSQHQAIFKEAERFASTNSMMIQEAPLQVYSAALVFCPRKSLSKELYWDQRFDFIDQVYVMQESWDVQVLESHQGSVRAVVLSPDGQTVASVSNDKTIRLWNAASGTQKRLLEGHQGSVLAVAFSPDGKTVASASNDETIRLWDAASGAQKQILEGHQSWVLAVVFSPDGQTIASASNDETIRLWDTVSGIEKQTLEGHRGWVRAVAFSPDGKTVASASNDETTRLWDAVSGTQKRILEGHQSWVLAVAFSPDGQTVASASDDKTIRLWDTASGTQKQILEGHRGWVRAVAFSLDGQTVASASSDKTIRLWDMATGVEKQAHRSNVIATSLSFLTDGYCLSSDRGSVPLKFITTDSLNNPVFVDQKWICRNGQQLIWLPPQYRAMCVLVKENAVVLGHQSGALTFMRLT